MPRDSSAKPKPYDGAIYKFLETSIGFVLTMVAVAFYMWLLITIVEGYLAPGLLPYKGMTILIGAMGGAMSIVLATSIRELGCKMELISQSNILNTAIVPYDGIERECESEPLSKHSSRRNGRKGDEEEEDEEICYDFTYM